MHVRVCVRVSVAVVVMFVVVVMVCMWLCWSWWCVVMFVSVVVECVCGAHVGVLLHVVVFVRSGQAPVCPNMVELSQPFPTSAEGSGWE